MRQFSKVTKVPGMPHRRSNFKKQQKRMLIDRENSEQFLFYVMIMQPPR